MRRVAFFLYSLERHRSLNRSYMLRRCRLEPATIGGIGRKVSDDDPQMTMLMLLIWALAGFFVWSLIVLAYLWLT